MDSGADGSETDLVRRARAGEQEAFRMLFDRHTEELRSRIQRWLSNVVQRKVSVADVLQEAHLVAFQRIRDFEHRESGSFHNWLVRIARLKAREAVRRHVGTAKRAAIREVSRPHRKETGQYAASGPSPSEAAATAELVRLVGRALEELPEHYRRILILTHEEGLSLREAAIRLRRPRESVKKLCGRAATRFAQVFARLQREPHE